MKKVLHIFRKLLPPTASFIRNQLMYHQDYQPFVMYAEDVEGAMAEEIRGKIPCYRVVEGRAGKLIYNKLRRFTPSEQKKALGHIRSIGPDIIHVHYGVDMLPFSSVLKKAGIPVVVSFYGYDCTQFPKRFHGLGKKWLQQRVFSHPCLKAVFAMTEDMQKDLLGIGCPARLVKVHYYGSECRQFATERSYAEKEEVTFCIISGLTYKKGHHFLLEAWKKMEAMTDRKHRLLIYGSGPLEVSIRESIPADLRHPVILAGPLKYGSPDHLKALQEADVFVHPSITAHTGDKEGIPGAIVEAMASGLPVVTTRHAGIPYIVRDQETGLLVDEHDTNQLAHALTLMCNQAEMRKKIGTLAREYALKFLDLPAKEKELETLYDVALLSS